MLPVIKNNESFKLVSIDPGSSNLGFSILEYDFIKESVTVLKSITLNLKDNDPKYRHLSDYHEGRTIRLMILKDLLKELFTEHSPHAVICESNYMGSFATSFAVLVECVAVIRSSLYEHDPFMKLNMIDPSTVKVNIGMKRIKGTTKEDVKDTLIASKKVNWGDINPDDLDEHAIDSVAIGVWFMENAL